MAGSNRHDLSIAMAGGEPIIFCTACAAYCSRRPQHLLLPCEGAPTKGRASMGARHLRQGCSPDCSGAALQHVRAAALLTAGPQDAVNLVANYLSYLHGLDEGLVLLDADCVPAGPGQECVVVTTAGNCMRRRRRQLVCKPGLKHARRLSCKTPWADTPYGGPGGGGTALAPLPHRHRLRGKTAAQAKPPSAVPATGPCGRAEAGAALRGSPRTPGSAMTAASRLEAVRLRIKLKEDAARASG